MKVKPKNKPLKIEKPIPLWLRITSSTIITVLLLTILTLLYLVLGVDTLTIGFNVGFMLVFIIADQLAYIMRNEFLQLTVAIAGMCGAAILTLVFLSSAFITLIVCVLFGLWNLLWLSGSLLKRGA